MPAFRAILQRVGLRRLEKDVLVENPDYVTIFFGANDCSESYPIDAQSYQEKSISND
ncbi:SGNH/GDSL hydrolase family protein [uncultured Enterococcus sp.]|uniref:SGNH/GDSL hydrolase family protein n=1 Tax=uncultured Enterococcus sp. TaxID=167972 RepID=UPI002AA88413|nr:SGNH/GDSL hydrolase family protein [uncultured Enterococcus sp.]